MFKSFNHLYEFGPFRLDPVRRLLMRDGEVLPLVPKAFDTLLALVESDGRVMEKDELMKAVWAGAIVEEVGLAKNISALRKTLGESLGENRYIVTVPGRGYRFVAGVRMIPVEVAVGDGLMVETHTVSTIVSEEELIEPTMVSVVQTPAAYPTETGAAASASGVRSLPGVVKRYKLAAAFASLIVILAVIGVWLMIGRQSSTNPALPAKLIPFAGLPGREDFAAFSPDGNQMAFVWDGGNGGRFDVYIKQIGLGEPLRLSQPSERDSRSSLTGRSPDARSPVWSPDGRYVAFLRFAPQAEGLEAFIVPALGGVERKLGQTELNEALLTWTPDGKSVVFPARLSPEGGFGLCLHSIETGERKQLTFPDRLRIDDEPVFSPDGQSLAFVRGTGGYVFDIYIQPLVGLVASGEPRRLTSDAQFIRGLGWTADGSEIVYSSNRVGLFSLWRIPASGGAPERVTAAGQNAQRMTISRQGDRLAYTETAPDTNIWSLKAPSANDRTAPGRGDAPVKIISSSLEDHSPQFSPDGAKIVFASNRSGSTEIWVCDSDGQHSRQLTSVIGASAGTPRWSPDGRQIAYDCNTDIFVISADGGAALRLTDNPAQDIVPSWSRDGQWIYFGSNRGGVRQIWKAPAAGGHPSQVTQHGGFECFESADGKLLYYTKNIAKSGIWQIPTAGGEEIPIPELATAGYWRYWAVTDQGIYFVPQEAATPPSVKFFSFATSQVSQFLSPEKGPIYGMPGLSVSPDGRRILYVQKDGGANTIMLLDNFR